MRFLPLAFVVMAASPVLATPLVVDFEDIPLTPNSFLNGGPANNPNNVFTSRGVGFDNTFSFFPGFGGFWSGFSISNVANATTPGFGNQYAAFPGSGANASPTYAVYYDSFGDYINLPAGLTPASVLLANTTYAALAIRDGDPFSKKFGGPSGNDPDLFTVTLTGHSLPSGTGGITGSVTLPLADFRFADNSLDYILADWLTVDLSPLGQARSISLSFFSTDANPFGPLTPTYVALDNLTLIPEPASLALLAPLATLLLRNRR
jgi:hypothetical protein